MSGHPGRNVVDRQLPTSLDVFGCYMLRPFAHPIACCWVLLGVIAQSLKPVKLSATCKRTQQLPALLGQQYWKLLKEASHRSYSRNFSSCEMRAWKKSRPVRDLNPWPLRYRCSALPIELTRANKPTGSRSLNWFVINPWKDDDKVASVCPFVCT